MRLLSIIETEKPESIKELAHIANRKPSNLSRTLRTMARYGIVELEKHGKVSKPVAKAVEFNIEYSVNVFESETNTSIIQGAHCSTHKSV